MAVGLSGKFNHTVGVRAARSILAINVDPAAPVFTHAHVGIVGDWHDVLPLLEAELRASVRALGVAGRERIDRCGREVPPGGTSSVVAGSPTVFEHVGSACSLAAGDVGSSDVTPMSRERLFFGS